MNLKNNGQELKHVPARCLYTLNLTIFRSVLTRIIRRPDFPLPVCLITSSAFSVFHTVRSRFRQLTFKDSRQGFLHSDTGFSYSDTSFLMSEEIPSYASRQTLSCIDMFRFPVLPGLFHHSVPALSLCRPGFTAFPFYLPPPERPYFPDTRCPHPTGLHPIVCF